LCLDCVHLTSALIQLTTLSIKEWPLSFYVYNFWAWLRRYTVYTCLIIIESILWFLENKNDLLCLMENFKVTRHSRTKVEFQNEVWIEPVYKRILAIGWFKLRYHKHQSIQFIWIMTDSSLTSVLQSMTREISKNSEDVLRRATVNGRDDIKNKAKDMCEYLTRTIS
jgi:hypothetical protein